MEPSADISAIGERVARDSAFVDRVTAELAKVVVGQTYMIERVLIGLLAGGHCLIEGVPGLAKTLAVSSLARSLSARFQRVQFTPDLLPADITGTTIYHPQTGKFSDNPGPIFANLVLADEINRAPAKVQSALLEAMAERQVTLGATTLPLPDPFVVLATQNPIEHEGTYALPEAQLDRFMLMVKVTYPTRAQERQILDLSCAPERPAVTPVAGLDDIAAARAAVSEIYIDGKIRDYIVDIVHATRGARGGGGGAGLAELVPLIEYGASPRATIYLAAAARAHAFLRHRGYVTPDDVKAIAADVLRHRIVITYEAEAEEIEPDDLVRRVLETVDVP